ncbi:hypothetical protein PybrP1_003044 [[Pythium] brassicae (nom. inval.)]|nr:hypothetical protein PybrP1_003044 [[Pythium] brassicae (nom. inval.)]
MQRRQSAPTLAAVCEGEEEEERGRLDPSSAPEAPDEQTRKLHARLRALYWAHDPRQVDKVDEILARQQGKEEAFIQRAHLQFGARDFSGEVAVDAIYEHERYSYLSFSYGSSFPGHLLLTDRRRWGGLHGSPSSQTREKVEPQLPVSWAWTSSWEVDLQSGNCDKDGWIYAFDFTMINSAIKRSGGRNEPRATDYVRRRRWLRWRQRVADPAPTIPPLVAAPASSPQDSDDDDEEVGEANDDDLGEIVNASNQHSHEPKNAVAISIDEVANDLNIDDEDDGGYDEDDEATAPDSNNNEEHVAPSPPLSMVRPVQCDELKGALPSLIAPSTPPNSGLQTYSMAMKKPAIDAAWNAAVKDLEAMYTAANAHKLEKKKQWGVKREKIKRQIHLMEKTVASMEAVALEEEKRRRVKNKNGASVVNLAAKMQCAQSKLDALKRQFWHPREKNYTLRFSVDGIFYGLREFFVETFKSSFSIHMSHQTNGAQGITPTCKIVLRGHTVCCGKHVKVTGDKGTRVPKSIWERMYLDTDFEASVYVIYVEDVKDSSHGRWELLCTPESTRVELINFTRRVNGGLDLPEPVVRKLCSDVLSSLVRDLTLIYFPQELAVAFDAPPAKLDLVGELEITGLPIDAVMERDIEFISNTNPQSQREDSSSRSLLAAAAAQLLSFLQTDDNMKQIAEALQLTPAQFNLLVALNDCALYPQPYSFKTIAGMCAYYNRFFVEEKPEGDETHEQKLRAAWKQALELLYIRKTKAAVAANGGRAGAGGSLGGEKGTGESPFALFDMDDLFSTIERLTKKPAAFAMTVKHVHCSLKVMSVVEAISKVYERVVLGVDFSKPRTGYDGFMYGFRFGRKAAVPKAVVNAVAEATASATNAAAQMLDPRLHLQLDVAFRARLKTFSQFFRSLKALLGFVKDNMEHVSAEVMGSLKGAGADCELNGSFKDVEFVGPVNVELGVPVCFLGLYRVETVALGGDDEHVGLQIELMLPKAEVPRQKALRRRKATPALESVCRVLVSDLSSEVLIDVDALIEQHRERSASTAAELTAPWSPSKSFAHKVELQKTNTKHQALAFSFRGTGSRSSATTATTGRDSNGDSFGIPLDAKVNSAADLHGNTASTGLGTGVHAGRFGKLKVKASEFTKLHANARAGSFATRLLPILNWVIAKHVRPLVQQLFPEHQALVDSLLAGVLQWASSPTMELNFSVLARAFIHDKRELVATFCGSPLHPAPIAYKDELLLLPLILQLDDLVNLWVDDRCPPYANPLYF